MKYIHIMTTNREIESKQMITTSIHNKLQEKYSEDSMLSKQVNYYIDTSDFRLKEYRSALRIEVRGNQYEVTLKIPARAGLLEYDYIVDIKPGMNLIIPNSNLPDDIHQIIVKQSGVEDTTLSVPSTLTTYRQGAKYRGDLLALDRGEYFDTVGYELEFEVKDYNRGLQKFQSLSNKLNLEHHQPLNKI